jgi:hypothetical protein
MEFFMPEMISSAAALSSFNSPLTPRTLYSYVHIKSLVVWAVLCGVVVGWLLFLEGVSVVVGEGWACDDGFSSVVAERKRFGCQTNQWCALLSGDFEL